MEERKMILKMVEEGKITAEEGVKLLQALEPEKKDEQNDKATTIGQEGTSLSTNVDWEKGGHSRRSYKEPSGTSFFTGFIESAFQKIKDLDFDFNFGSYVEVEHIFQHTNFNGDEIDLSIENGSITIEPWDSDDVRIESKAKVYRVHEQEDARHTLLRESVFQTDEEKLKFYTKVKSIKVELTAYIPRKAYKKLNLYTFNGHLEGSELEADLVGLKVVNGSITLNRGKFNKLTGETINGPLKLLDASGERSELKTMNGAITVGGSITDLDVDTVNGTVNYHLHEAAPSSYAELKAATGSIQIYLPADVKVNGKLKTNVGGFSCELNGLEITEEKKDFMQKSLSFVANKEASSTLKLEAETNTGSVQIEQR